MIIESLISDDKRVAFDCCKATIARGDTIEIRDEFYHHAEIQGAIKLGLVKIVGDAPTVANPADAIVADERCVKFVSRAGTTMAFDCIKKYVAPNDFILVPESKLEHAEIRNAIDSGWLVNPEVPATAPVGRTDPVAVDEVAIVDKVPASRPRRRRVQAAPAEPAIRARRVASSSESDDSASEDDASAGEMYSESRVIDRNVDNPLRQRKPAAPAKPVLVEDDNKPEEKGEEMDRFSFMDIFGSDK